MKKYFNFLFSTRLMAVLFILFATAMGVATFIENDFGTQTAKALVYNAWWFEAIMVFFIINFCGNIFRYQLYKKEKWAVLMFHLAFIFIILGAAVTRYIGFEGIMLINEGETTNQFLTDKTFVNLVVDDGKEQKTIHQDILLSAWGKNSWSFHDDFRGKEYKITLENYIPWAEKTFVEDTNGDEYLHLVESSSGNRHDHYLKKGTTQNIHNILVSYEAEQKNATINIFKNNDTLKIITKVLGSYQVMATQQTGVVQKDSVNLFKTRALYNIAGLPFVVPENPSKGRIQTIKGAKNDNKKDVIILDLTTNNSSKTIELIGGKFSNTNYETFSLDGLNFTMWYGAKVMETPFSIKLNDFQLEKYPGSESAASYASEVTVIDPKETFDYRIYMNHILNYKGYRFFQSSYDLSGETEQTQLSVNHDFWGTFITYLGYSLLYIGLICILFAKHTRFDDLKKSLQKIRVKKNKLATLSFLFFLQIGVAQNHNHTQTKIPSKTIDSILQANKVDEQHALEFSKLIIQDAGGRMKPAHTFASELVRKVAQTEKFNNLTPSQVLLSIIENPRLWFEVPVIYLEKGNTQIREILGIAADEKYARLSDFITPNGTYKIKEQVAEAQKKNVQNKYEKDLIKIDRRVGLLYSAIGGGILKIYPIPNDENNKWVSQPETFDVQFSEQDSLFVRKSLPLYIQLLQNAKKSNDYSSAQQILNGIIKFQKMYGVEVYPSENKIKAEIAYNNYNVFSKLVRYYGLTSVLLIFFVVLQIFYSKKWIGFIIKFLIGIVIIEFIVHILGLATRWYISGNAPWSNAYESIIYVAFTTMLFGLFLGRKSALTIAATTFVSSIILFTANMNWLDPEIANLQPVLNSWWLLVHVSIIVASYGPLTLGMILGVVALFLVVFTTKKNKEKMDINIKEITIINEMAVTVGVVMLTVGNFLGGMWANESWGRYWGWDPKETWALISIMIYAFVLHMRLIPGLRGRYTYNLWSIIAYASIMMTYFGVNFYLSGLHSYASGDKVITPNSVYYSVGFVIILGTISWFKYNKYYQK